MRAATQLLKQVLEPIGDTMSIDAAKRLVRFKPSREIQKKVDALAVKCNEGTLTPEERADYESYVEMGTTIAILKAKARLIIAQNEQ